MSTLLKDSFFSAVRDGDTNRFDALVRENPDAAPRLFDQPINDTSKTTLLHVAAERGDGALFLDRLNRQGINTPDDNGQTPLHVAAKHEKSASVARLATAENIVMQDANGNTALHLAVIGDKKASTGLDLATVQEILSTAKELKAPDVVHITNNAGHTPAQAVDDITSRSDVKETLQHYGLRLIAGADAVKETLQGFEAANSHSASVMKASRRTAEPDTASQLR